MLTITPFINYDRHYHSQHGPFDHDYVSCNYHDHYDLKQALHDNHYGHSAHNQYNHYRSNRYTIATNLPKTIATASTSMRNIHASNSSTQSLSGFGAAICIQCATWGASRRSSPTADGRQLAWTIFLWQVQIGTG